jgi:single-strand DNA-binding protein
MNELTIHGNLTAEPELKYSQTGTAVVSFTVAVNRRRYNRTTGQWQPLDTVFHRVVAFGQLAENAAISLDKGVTVTVTGELGDDSWTSQDGQRHVRTQVEAADVAISLRYGTAKLTKVTRETDSQVGVV